MKSKSVCFYRTSINNPCIFMFVTYKVLELGILKFLTKLSQTLLRRSGVSTY